MTGTPAQFKEARKLLGWSQGRLVEGMGVSQPMYAKFEARKVSLPSRETMLLVDRLESAGVEFIAENGGGAGVRLKKPTDNR